MCVVKTCFLGLLFMHCFFLHASSALPHQKIQFRKFGPNGSITRDIIDLCNKNKLDTNHCNSSLHKALLQVPRSEDSRSSRHLNVREMDLHHSSIFSEEGLSETTDYQAPHRKSPIHNK